MKNLFKWFGIIALVAIIGFSIAACKTDDDSSGGGTDPALNGTWVRNDNGYVYKFNNGSFEMSTDGMPFMRGTYTTNGNIITMKITGIYGGDSDFASLGLTSRWYSRSEFTAATGITDDLQLNDIFQTFKYPYSLYGITLTLGTATYTRGGTSPTPTYSIDGVWETAGGTRVFISGSIGTLNALGSLGSSSPLWADAISKGYVYVGIQFYRNITKSSTSNLTWSGQGLGVTWNTSPSQATGTGWMNNTFTMSTDGQTLTAIGTGSSGTYTNTYTRK